jgi:hypothetical protein
MEPGAGRKAAWRREHGAESLELGVKSKILSFEASDKAGNHFAFFLQIVKQIVFVLIIY